MRSIEWWHAHDLECPLTTQNHLIFCILRGNWQDFNSHDASRGPSAIAELLVSFNSLTDQLSSAKDISQKNSSLYFLPRDAMHPRY